MPNGKIEANQQRPNPSSTDLSFLGDNLVELVCQNGQIMMQGQINKNKKNPMSNSNSTSTNYKIGKFGTIESYFNDVGVSNEPGLSYDDELIRWLNYPVNENPPPEYFSELLPEISGVTTKDPHTSNNFTLINKADRVNPTVRDSTSFGSGNSDLFSNSSVMNFPHFPRSIPNNARGNPDIVVDLPNSDSPAQKNDPKSGPICQEIGGRNGNEVIQTKGVIVSEKRVEPMITSSSVCSANDPTNNSKRKSRNSEDSEWQSEDIDEESVGVKKTAACGGGGTSSKRSRAAEVHNLSERRRRDRINEKMRALQELIPNCNKVDKASMLDEAIEHLKSLQLQVQMMSMGSGLYMPSLMFQNSMQHMNPTLHLPQFSMGYGIGMHGPHFHHPHNIPMPANFQGLAGSNLRLFGQQTQGHPVSASMPMLARPPINLSTGFQATNGGIHLSGSVQKDDQQPDTKDC